MPHMAPGAGGLAAPATHTLPGLPLPEMPTSPSLSFSFKTQLGSYLPSEHPHPLTGWGHPLEHGHPHHVPFLPPCPLPSMRSMGQACYQATSAPTAQVLAEPGKEVARRSQTHSVEAGAWILGQSAGTGSSVASGKF